MSRPPRASTLAWPPLRPRPRVRALLHGRRWRGSASACGAAQAPAAQPTRLRPLPAIRRAQGQRGQGQRQPQERGLAPWGAAPQDRAPAQRPAAQAHRGPRGSPRRGGAGGPAHQEHVGPRARHGRAARQERGRQGGPPSRHPGCRPGRVRPAAHVQGTRCSGSSGGAAASSRWMPGTRAGPAGLSLIHI